MILSRGSQGLFLLQRVRDEAHRFAIAYQRQKRSRSTTTAPSTRSPGWDRSGSEALLRHFGSLRKIKAADAEALQQVPGIGPRLAETIVATLSEQPSAERSGHHHGRDRQRLTTATGLVGHNGPCVREQQRAAHSARQPSGDRWCCGRTAEVLVLTGMSGAGRSTAANALEDLGWFVVDNMPPALLARLVELARQGRAGRADLTPTPGLRIAAVADVRGGEFFGDLQAALGAVEALGIEPRVVFLEADDDALVRRFEASRRPHPLQGDGRLVDGIAARAGAAGDAARAADLLIDTSRLNVHQLRRRIETAFAATAEPTAFRSR